MNNHPERIVLITGGSSGLGFEMARQMVAQRSTVIICGRSQEKLDKAYKKVSQLIPIRCDVSIPEEREALFNKISERFQGLNMLMNNAGLAKRYLLAKTEDLELKLVSEWQTNYLAPVLLTRQFLPLLTKNKGTVVNVTSGLVYAPLSIQPNYCATKAALHSMTQSMRMQFSKLGIKMVEILYPAVDTPFHNRHVPKHAIQPDKAAAIALLGINRGKDEIRVKRAGLLFMLHPLMPRKALNLINIIIPVYVEELIA
jgi:uncharacterized oxidoreductase